MIVEPKIEVYPSDEGWTFRWLADGEELMRSSKHYAVYADARAVAEIARTAFRTAPVDAIFGGMGAEHT